MNGHQKQQGSVLLTTLLVMAVMAALAVAIMDQISFAVKRTVNVQAYAQADWYVLGAQDFAGQYLSRIAHNLSAQAMNTALTNQKPIVFPLENGAITLTIRDGSHCLSLGALLTSAGTAYTPGQRRFAQLLRAIGWAEQDADRLAAAGTDWADRDSQTLPNGAEDFAYMRRTPAHRTANTAFVSVQELRALGGMTEARFQALLPYVCARPAGHVSQVNINTLHAGQAALLAAMLGGADNLRLARQLITQRPEGGYRDLEQLRAAPALEGVSLKDAAFDQILYQPGWFWIEAKVEIKGVQRLAAFEYALTPDGRVVLTHRGVGADALRPKVPELNT